MESDDGETMKIETIVLLKNNFSVVFYLRELTKYSQRSLEMTQAKTGDNLEVCGSSSLVTLVTWHTVMLDMLC